MKNKIINIIALSVLSVAVIGLIAYSFVVDRALETYRQEETLSREAVMEGMVHSAERLDAEMAKLCISEDAEQGCRLLSEIWKNTGELAAQVDLAPLGQAEKLELEAFVNVVGDYAHELEKSLRQEGTLNEEDREQLADLSKTVGEVLSGLRHAREKGSYENSEELFEEQEYAQIAYEGKFSQSFRNRPPAGLPAYDITEQKALRTAEEFAGVSLFPVAHTDGEVMPFYNFENQEGNVRVSITKQGGGVLYYKNHTQTDGLSVIPAMARLRKLEQAAADFLDEHGYQECVIGRRSYYNGMAFFEMIPKSDGGVLLISDRIRLWMNLQSGEVMGMDAGDYLMNHHEREFPEEILSAEDAEANLSEELTVRERWLCVIPKENGEAFCYGFLCENGEDDFLVFLNGETGAEEEIFKMIDQGNRQEIL